MNISKLTVTDSGSGRLHNCVMHNATFQTICWGTDSYNQVNGGIPLPLTPPITSGVTISAAPTLTGPLDASNGKTCAIVGSGTSALNATVQCWGNRALGRQLGDNLPTPTISTAPVNVIGVP